MIEPNEKECEGLNEEECRVINDELRDDMIREEVDVYNDEQKDLEESDKMTNMYLWQHDNLISLALKFIKTRVVEFDDFCKEEWGNQE